MKTMNGFMNERVVRKTTKKNWKTRCGSFLIAILATCYGDSALNFATAAELQRSGGYGQNITIDPSQADYQGGPNIGAGNGYTIGKAGEAATWEVATGHPNGLVLNDVDDGDVQAYLLNTEPDPDVRAGTVTFTSGDIFRGTGDMYTIESDMSWLGAFDATGQFNTQGYELTIASNNFSVGAGGLLINYMSAGAVFSDVGRMIVNGGSNGNIINIGTGTLRVGGTFSNNGTIDISSLGVLEIDSSKSLSGIINGGGFNGASTELSTNYNDLTNWVRGCIDLLGDARFSGTWTGEITVNSRAESYTIPTELGGFTLNARGSNGSNLTTLRILGGTDVLIDNQSNLGIAANVIFGNGGYLTKPADVGELTLRNNIIFNTRMGGLGGVNANGNVVSWTDNADFIYDSGNRVILEGLIDSTLTRGNTFHINYDFNGDGAVAITNTGNTYDGSYYIHTGALEISDARVLGPHGDALHSSATNGIIIGDNSSAYSDPAYRAAFRFVGEGGITNPQIMERWIEVAHISSAYEVFTASNRITGSDTNNETTDQADEETEGTNQVDNGVTIVTNQVDNGATISDINRLHVIQNGLIGGAGNLNKAGDGVLILNSDQNTYTGNTIIHHGVLSISSNLQINDTASRRIVIGTTNYQSDGFRPVFETTLGAKPELRPESGTIIIRYANVEVNLNNSVIRTTGKGNETIIKSDIVSEGTATSRFAVLHKEGAGTLTLQGNGRWGYNGEGLMVIRQGTLQFSHVTNLTTGDITIGLNLDDMTDPVAVKDIDKTVDYEAVLKLAENMNTVTLTNSVKLGSQHHAYFDVGIGSELAVNGVIGQIQNTSADLNKTGLGSLVLNGTSNAYTGWTNIERGTLRTTKANNLVTSQGVDLIGEGTTLDMSTAGADQTLNALRGGTDVDSIATLENSSDWTRKILIGDNSLTLNIQNFKAGDTQNNQTRNEFRGHIIGSGTVVKQGSLTVASGFTGFNGTFDIQAGILQTLTDTTLVGIKGKAGTYLDIRDNQLNINIGSSQQYDGTIISSYPALPYAETMTSRPSIIKDGAGTLTTSFYNQNIGTGVVQSFQGDLTIKQGNIISTSDFHMEGNSNLTFYVNPDLLGSVSPLVLDVSKHSAVFLPGGRTGKANSTVHVYAGDNTTGWTTPSGTLTVGKILGNDESDYTGLKAATTDSLYYTLGLQDIYGTSRHDLYVNLNVTGFGGVGNTYNTKAAGEYLDNARVTDLTQTGLAPLIQELWAFGSNVTETSTLTATSTNTLSRAERLSAVRGVLQQIAPDTIANGMFMGLDQPWRVAFDRLNLDSQMVYVTPPQNYSQQYRGQVITNMRNLWFTPTVQTVSVRSDGVARKFGIDRPGYKIGFDKRVAQNTSVGFQLGYSAPKLRQNDDRIEGSDFQAGLYGGSMVGNYIELKGFIGFGHQSFKSNRNVYVALPGYSPKSFVAHGRYRGDTFNFSFDISRPLFLGFAILRPTIGLDSEHAFRYAFTETGSPIAMKFDRASLSRTRARFGLSLETTTLDRAIFTGRLGYSALLGGHDFATVTGGIVGTHVPLMSVKSVAIGKSFFEAGVGTKIFLNPVKTLALVGNYDATVANRWAEHQALVGFTYIY